MAGTSDTLLVLSDGPEAVPWREWLHMLLGGNLISDTAIYVQIV